MVCQLYNSYNARNIYGKNIWHIEKLLSMAWYGAMIPMNSSEYIRKWQLRKIAENMELLKLYSGVILVNAFNCRFQLWIADAFTPLYCTDGNYLRLRV